MSRNANMQRCSLCDDQIIQTSPIQAMSQRNAERLQEIEEQQDQLIERTVNGHYPTLGQQILSVISMAEIAIQRAETSHPNILSKGWGKLKYLTEQTALDGRARNIEHYETIKESALTLLYIRLLIEVRRLVDTVFQAVSLDHKQGPLITVKYLLTERLEPPALPSLAMLNAITPTIFSIFMLATRLLGNIKNKAALVKLGKIEQRAQEGGKASNHGKEVMIKYFTKVITDLTKTETHPGVESFIRDNHEEIRIALIKFQSEKQYTSDGKRVSAGLKMTTTGLTKAFREWAREDSDFGLALQKKVPKVKRGSSE